MSSAREIRPAVLERQIAAADPDRSVFVSANAGSGKTHVLAQRVINLLLRGTPPEKILCITFTKAAAANMATRVFDTLAAWTALDDKALDARIRSSTGRQSDARQRAAARRLFATALETPGGLKVQTIHAFCTRLLHQFPFEADVAASFEVLDDATTTELLNEQILSITMQAAAEPDSPLGKALAIAITSAADITFKEVITEAIGMRDVISQWVARAGSVAAAIDELTRTFGLVAGDSLEAIENECFSASLIPESEWSALTAALSGGAKTDKDRADALASARRATGRERVEAFLDVFCTDARKRRENIVTKGFAKDNPEWSERLSAEQDRICALVAREFAVRARDRSAALLTIAHAVIERYRAAKDRRGLLDYEDLIDKTLALFRNTAAAWVLYKLDLGIDHVLVDEAQDTSPKQWDIIRTLVAEFIVGGARENVKRTVFAVGDEKQSIFSFQGAAPLAFADNRRHFATLFQDAFAQERLEYSFRSGPAVLNAVDTVFSREEAYRGLSHDQVKTVHQAVFEDAPGEVEIWDLIAPDAKDPSKEGWDAPFDLTSETSPAIKLAAKIARTVKQWCARGTQPRDILILVRQRGPAFEAAIRALKREGIPVAGADRLVLTEHIAVMDLLALGDALLLPDDDLSLATVLKSPLFGLNEEQLYTLAYGRKGPLRSALHEKAGGDPMFAKASASIDELSSKARTHTPFAFYAYVLGANGGRRKFLARLGIEASDPLDEFLNLALDYQRRETHSLQGFLDWLRAAQSEVKRDMEMERDEVRVMTVHGAKGLEAKNVILIDATTTRPEGAHPPRLLTTPLAGAHGEVVIWAAAKNKDAGPMSTARNAALTAAREEYRRLLYVGMTRAAERLVVCGTKGVNKIPDDCWHKLVLDALGPQSIESEDSDVGRVWRFHKNSGVQTETAAGSEQPSIGRPDWLETPMKPDPTPPRLITPSDQGEDAPRRAAGQGDRDKALRRGTLIHRLLQSLPDIPTGRRHPAMQRYLDRSAADFGAAGRAEIAEHVARILDDPRFAALFGSHSRAEVPIVGWVQGGIKTLPVSGQVDRLALTPDAVFIADYKTNRAPPRQIDKVPPAYIRQLAAYRAVLKKLYPDRPVRAALIWTEVPELMELSAAEMDAALARVTSA